MVRAACYRILIVDDSREVHDDFRRILQHDEDSKAADAAEAAFFGETVADRGTQRCYQLDHAFQGAEALELVQQAQQAGRPFAFAFVDMRMPPGWDGVETIERLWEADSELQIVVCTAHAYSWTEMVERLGINDRVLLLKKPFDNAEVMQLAIALTEKRRLTDIAAMKFESLEQLVAERTASLREAHLESERILDAISSIVVGTDETGVVNRWNESAAEVFGISAKETMGHRLVDLPIAWEDAATIRDLFAPDEAGDGRSRFEAPFKNAEGQTRILGLSAYPVGSKEDRKGTLLLGRDLTERKIVEHQLQHAQKLESVGQLAAGVAHEINTPMQYLGDNLDFLHNKVAKLAPLLEAYEQVIELAEAAEGEQELLTDVKQKLKKLKVKNFLPQVEEAITDSSDGVKHVSRIVRAMKEFSHPGQDEKVPLDINNSVESAVAVSTNEWKYVADVEFDLDSTIPLVSAFPGELNQVFLNIIVNAAHAISDVTEGGANGKGTITVSTRCTEEDVMVAIADTGTGIPDDVKQRIFDPFFTTKEVGKGTGQGLSIAYSVVTQKHGGKLTCESVEGQGTTFKIQLPINDCDKETENQLEPAACEV